MGNLQDHIAGIIRTSGPISVAQYMEICLTHPTMGYYTTRDPLGKDGDFTTAPEISQVFGELIGLFFAEYWLGMEQPTPVHFIELGPGRGTLMADALRAIKIVPELEKAVQVHFIDVSPSLKGLQKKAVTTALHHESLDEIPPGVSFIIANEFFDVLPIRQFIWQDGAWAERMVAEHDGKLAFSVSHDFPPAQGLPGKAEEGTIWESAPQSGLWISGIAQRLNAAGGLGLIIDYGYGQDAFGDSFQAVQNQKPVDVFEAPGAADLTAHVNFADLAERARSHDLQVFDLITQGAFLNNLGIDHRAGQLLENASKKQKKEIEAAVNRLTNDGQMGELFKVLCFAQKGAPEPVGLS